eukprot:TRINITY_DN13157_c0_g1_i1.p1 TRINITY_DN13157_c0_g1~~TRINITY_DN13157_c0_g1_i1.p1  ORF type:complete len:102 (-),score=31.43 TRINITY_DN13157_c0_g1_i1:15-320(-)
MIRRPPRSTLSSSSAASDVYKRQRGISVDFFSSGYLDVSVRRVRLLKPVSYTHLRAHETPEHLVCRLLLEKKKKKERKKEQKRDQKKKKKRDTREKINKNN